MVWLELAITRYWPAGRVVLLTEKAKGTFTCAPQSCANAPLAAARLASPKSAIAMFRFMIPSSVSGARSAPGLLRSGIQTGNQAAFLFPGRLCPGVMHLLCHRAAQRRRCEEPHLWASIFSGLRARRHTATPFASLGGRLNGIGTDTGATPSGYREIRR